MILEEAPKALGKRCDGFREDYSVRDSSTSTFARSTNLVTAAQAVVLLDLSGLPTLLRSKFQTRGMLDSSAQVPNAWRVASFAIDLVTYGAVFPHTPDPSLTLRREDADSKHIRTVKSFIQCIRNLKDGDILVEDRLNSSEPLSRIIVESTRDASIGECYRECD